MNLRPVILLPEHASKPGELLSVSPTALRGPDHGEWSSLGKARNYSGQMAILAKQKEAFKRAFKIHYTRRVRKTHNMQQKGKGFSEGDVVMILDLSASERQPPYPQLGVINKFMDPLNSQAVIHYGHKNGRYKVVAL